MFWIRQFGGDVPDDLLPDYESDGEPRITITENVRGEDELIAASPLARARG